jgi:NDP-sugar pyrophosphorylase family protein
MNIVIPIVGRGTRVKDKFNLPKPLIVLKSKTIIEHCVESLGFEGNYIFIVRKFTEFGEFADEYTERLKQTLRTIKPGCKIIEIDYVTEGPASSILLAKEFINTTEELITTNCDQKTLWNPSEFLMHVRNKKSDGAVTTYPHPNIIVNQRSPYSFVELNEDGFALRFEEKFAISEHALNGIHYWKNGSLFVESVEDMIKNNDRVNNEFYISKSYNFLVKNKKTVVTYRMNKEQFFALGDEEEIKRFQNNENI